jgi:hypothetical protein
MAKPINITEHNASFIKYLIFFILTLTMAVCAVYFNFKLPNKELKLLRKRDEQFRTQQLNQENYKRTLIDIMQTLKSLDSNNNSGIMVKSELDDKIVDLQRVSNIDDSSAAQRLNKVIFRLVNEYRDAKFKLNEYRDCDKIINDKDVKIAELRKDLDDCKARNPINNSQD